MAIAKCSSAHLLIAALGDLLANARIERGLSQRELAALAGVSKSLISGVEMGTREPTLFVLLRLSAALDIPLSGLLSPLDDFSLHDGVHG